MSERNELEVPAVDQALSLLVQAARVSPHLRAAVAEVERHLNRLRSAVWRIVNEVDECDHVTTEGGDRFMLTDEEADAVRAALRANDR